MALTQTKIAAIGRACHFLKATSTANAISKGLPQALAAFLPRHGATRLFLSKRETGHPRSRKPVNYIASHKQRVSEQAARHPRQLLDGETTGTKVQAAESAGQLGPCNQCFSNQACSSGTWKWKALDESPSGMSIRFTFRLLLCFSLEKGLAKRSNKMARPTLTW